MHCREFSRRKFIAAGAASGLAGRREASSISAVDRQEIIQQLVDKVAVQRIIPTEGLS